MARLPFDIGKMLSAPGIYKQMKEARIALKGELEGSQADAEGLAYEICKLWQDRFEWALRGEVPDWIGFAAFRCITDYVLPLGGNPAVYDFFQEYLGRRPKPKPQMPVKPDTLHPEFPDFPGGIELEKDFPQEKGCPQPFIDDEEFWRAYLQYFHMRATPNQENMCSGKPSIKGELAEFMATKLNDCDQLLGGQAGNILWLWLCIGATARTHLPYLYSIFSELPSRFPLLGRLEILRMEGGTEFPPLERITKCAGVRTASGGRVEAPSGGSMVLFKDSRRLCYQYMGIRIPAMKDAGEMQWDKVRFLLKGQDLSSVPLLRDKEDLTWPALPFFCDCSIDEQRTLRIKLADADTIGAAFRGRAGFAVLSGIDAIFYNPWFKRDKVLQARLAEGALMQWKALAKCGIRIGVELSNAPNPDYARFLQCTCREGITIALGINGEDELPRVVGGSALDNGLFDFWFDEQALEARGLNPRADDKFEYLTYLRALTLAGALGVRTVYIHTTNLDFILRKDADPGALLHAQQGDMMGKGLVIAALMQRAYGKDWLSQLKQRMPPAVKPGAMAKLARFAADFEKFEPARGAAECLLRDGYWMAPSASEYSVAVVPVMWPPIEQQELNTTGAGDMTFGAFFFLGGV